MKHFTAVTESGANIITVLANGLEEAKVAIAKELKKNPSRIPFLNKWKEDGELVEEK
jgi:hypothetical protein